MSFDFNAPMGMNIENIYPKFIDTLNEFNNKINIFVQKANKTKFDTDNLEVSNQIYLIESRKDFIAKNCKDFFDENKEYIFYQIVGSSFFQDIQNFIEMLDKTSPRITIIDIRNVLSSIQELFQVFLTITNIVANEKKANKLISELEEQVEKATSSVKSVISAKEALESKPTEEIYSNAAKKYIKTARFYDVLLLVLLGIFYYLTTQFFQNFQMIAIFKAIQKSSSEAQTLAIFFFVTKLTIVSIVITLATIFIRRSSHFRKLHDQANQTSLELNALPFYLRQVDSELHSEIYKEMIPKFFGKELDQSQNDKVGDLLQDQIKAGTELVRASAELVTTTNTKK